MTYGRDPTGKVSVWAVGSRAAVEAWDYRIDETMGFPSTRHWVVFPRGAREGI